MKKIFQFVVTFIIAILISVPAFSYSISSEGINHIKKYEGLCLVSYWDSNGYSIGYGHHSSDVKKGMKISEAKANEFLYRDIKEAEEYAHFLIKRLPYTYSFSQGFYDGLVDLIYNCGIGNVQSSSFYNRLKKCRVKNGIMDKSDYDFTIAAVKTLCVTCKGHVARRKAVHQAMIL